ncbi:DUF429 domain-containing protein [Lichenicola sp.]|uniref:DUF429 domain-containing protein n=1 Tax=Lichenicola sp. TaxID=2804529 RepID=UPI003B000B22
MREILIGFDSAWTDNLRNPGAIAAVVIEDGQPAEFVAPRLASFADALKLVLELGATADVLLVAIDQPTIVPNLAGCRPVERVAASIVNRLKGGVQPARRGGGGASMFGDDAPIWGFLAAIDVVQNPAAARNATSGRFAMEVFPALALPSLVPAIWERKRAAKYNPVQRKTFLLTDWQIVCDGLATQADRLGLPALAAWARAHHPIAVPKKADQDRLDAALCLLICRYWRQDSPAAGMVIGDDAHGYIATPVTAETRAILAHSAARNGVPVDTVWTPGPNLHRKHAPSATGAASGDIVSEDSVSGAAGALAEETAARLGVPMDEVATPSPEGDREMNGFRVDDVRLRQLLVGLARTGEIVSYGSVASHFMQQWSRAFSSSLTAALARLCLQNKALGEPSLMCLVVNSETRRPGRGFYPLIGEMNPTIERQQELFEQERARCHAWSWPDP